MNLDDFVKVSRNRVVRDNGQVMMGGGSQDLVFYTVYDWPFIEEFGVFLHRKDSRIALVTRNVFDYITRRPYWRDGLTYGSDISTLEVPFESNDLAPLLVSKVKSGPALFTVNLSPVNGTVKVYMPKKLYEISMENRDLPFPALLEHHRSRMEGFDFENDSKLVPAFAVQIYNQLMEKSPHVV